MDLKKIIGMAAKEEVIGKIIKTPTFVDNPSPVRKSRIAIGLGFLAVVAGYLANYF